MISCVEEHNDQKYQYKIDDRLNVYVNEFFLEAADRNFFFKKENLIVEIVDSLEDAIAISRNVKGQRKILMIKSFYEKYKYRYYYIESVIFHEMGHSFLKRKHVNHHSIMNTKSPYSLYDHDKIMRHVLLNELFYGDTVNIWDDKYLPL